ncbi:MAG: transglycosylase SLT domain-containing protein [Burkholderiales bacterium]|uniref:transglycosylase SLT domain-containing protein n=1 Tax=Limnobacter sp. TaxID=2003368 RepID=UPI00394B8189|nr:transglycosylase SLT domain-containing protein [Burkholderiales bacterium]
MAVTGPITAILSIVAGLIAAPELVWATTLKTETALNTDNQEVQLFGLVDPNPGLELKMTGPFELITLDFAGEPDDVWANIRKGFSMPDLDTQAVRVRERALLKNKRLVRNMLQRSEPFIYFIAQECAKRGMPSELALLPFIESQFNPHARSPSAAEGLWQFIPSTGRQFDLKQNKWVDERRDLVASTRAALDYLTYLYDMHGDWHLALLSYNWGEGSVLKAVKKAQDAGLQPTLGNLELPQETRHYIPKLQALKNLIQSPERFDMTLPEVPNKPYFAEIKRNGDIDLREIARLAGVELEIIRKLNPGLNQPVLYAAHSNTLLVPIEHSAKIRASLKEYKTQKAQRSYTVKKGDTLGEIAQRFDVSVKALQRLNGLGSKKLIKPGMKLSIPNNLAPGSRES